MPTVFATPRDLLGAVGKPLGASDWLEIRQDRIDGFADATGDHQWIHVDPERAKGGPFGRTIAHGYLTLAVIPALLDELLNVDGVSQAINYGLDKVRFPAPAPVGSRVRLTAAVERVEPVRAGFQAALAATVECDAAPRPVCVARALYRYIGTGTGSD
jgi:acyl dehydratase